MSADSKQNAFLEENLGRLPEDNRRFLEKIKERFDRVELNLPTVEVRFKNLSVEANCQLVHGKPIPTLFNELKSSIHEAVKGVPRIFGVKFREAKIAILRDVSGIIMPTKYGLPYL